MRKSQKHTGQPIRIKRWFNAGTYGPGSPGRQQPRSIELSVPLLPDPRTWDAIFPDPAMTVAAVDRLVHHSIILEMNTKSYRRKVAEANSPRATVKHANKVADA